MATFASPSIEEACDNAELRSELVAHARRILGDEGARAEDVVQEAYVHLLRRAGDGEAPHSPRPWLHSVVHSLCLRELGRRRRHQPTEIESLAAPGADPAELAQIAAEVRWALAGVAALPEREQATMVADLAGVAQGREGANARYQALHRARQKLRELRREAWALVPLPLLRWSRLGGPAHAGAGGAAPAAIATGGVAKGALAAGATALALAGGHVVMSLQSPDHPQTPARVTVAAAPYSHGARGAAVASAQTPMPAPAPARASVTLRGARTARTPNGPPSISAPPSAAAGRPFAASTPAAAAPSPPAEAPSVEAPSVAAPAAPRGAEPARPPQTQPPVVVEEPAQTDRADAPPDIQAPEQTDAPEPVAPVAGSVQDSQPPDSELGA